MADVRGKLNFSGSDPAADGKSEAESEAREVRQTAHAGPAGAKGWGAAGAPAAGEVGGLGFSARGDVVDEVEDVLAVLVGFAGCGAVVVVEERHFGEGRVWVGLRGSGRRESWLRVVGVGRDSREWSFCRFRG